MTYTTLSAAILVLSSLNTVAYATPSNTTTFSATSITGQQLPEGDAPIYLKFWATWCSYCLEEMPHLQETYQETHNKLQVIAVNVGFNQNIGLIRRYMNKHRYTIPTIFDAQGHLVQQFKVTGTPTHILLDSDGNEVYRSALLTDELKQRLEALK
ncbi:TlpA family protein disulfide reductase [Pseudoalteromonas aurantia]|uniref:TlpA family protein disulfide reductase n=1 Tax=Pseudoalteromonas aurantia TaxID=43654 RepID=A0ABY2VTP0_9GAMM|nr:TlpA disulfide reductase family protein [Pseudoalteromonas aurantia]TMO71329.1 TlpA family protein disulfide reductase [Pseudoalteromonas aurantia]